MIVADLDGKICLFIFHYSVQPHHRILSRSIYTYRIMYRTLHHSGLSDFYAVQDIKIPYGTAEKFALWLEEQLKLYPLWLCPLRLQKDSLDAHHGLHSEFANASTPGLIYFGVWGLISFNRRKAVRQNRALELKVHELG